MSKAIAFFFKRFSILFFGLFIFPFPLSLFNFLDEILENIDHFYQWLIPWIGKNILFLEKEITVFTNGSGDTTYDYLLIAFKFALSIIIAMLWMIYDLKTKKERAKLWSLFKSGMIYYLASVLISYGLFKIIPIQFSPPSFFRLMRNYGDSSPMGLAWTFFGFSKGYSLFLGLGELIGGVLLLHRKTRLLGIILSLSILCNIVAINFFFDVPVKLFSTLLLLITLIVGQKHLKQIWALSFNNQFPRNIEKKSSTLSVKSKSFVFVLKLILIFFIFFKPITRVVKAKKNNIQFNKPLLYGLYKTDLFVLNKDTLNVGIEHPKKWNYLGVEYANSMQFYKGNF